MLLTLLSPGLILSALNSNPSNPTFCDGFVSAAIESPVTFTIEQAYDKVSLTVAVEGVIQVERDDGLLFRIPNEGINGREGYPDLPAISRWVGVPDHGRLELSYDISSEQRIAGSPPAIYRGETEDGIINRNLLNVIDGIYPPEPLIMSRPMVMRGVRVVLLTFYPVHWDVASEEYIQVQSFTAEIKAVPGDGINEVESLNRRPSKGFDRMLDALLVNPPRRDQPDETYLPGGYLIVAGEDAPEAVQEFIDWKRRAGHPVELLTIDGNEIGVGELHVLIREQYEELGFEFLVFMGTDDADQGSPLHIPFDNEYYDIFYAQLEGNDRLPDVAVGTFNCITEENFTCAIRRAMSYQYTPYFEVNERDWFTRAGVGVGECSVPQDLSPSYTGKWIAEVLSRRQFDDISTSFFADEGPDDPSRMIERLYNENTNFIIVRAHQGGLDVNNIEPGPVYPFHFLVSSGTISPPEWGAFNRAFRQGTPDEIKGPSAGFGHNSSPRTNCANALVGGLTEALFFLDIDTYGWARNYAVANLVRVMVEDGVGLMPYYYSHWRYYGDPGQWCWVGVPQRIDVFNPRTIDIDATHFEISVFIAGQRIPVPGATICLSQPDGLQLVSLTDEMGEAHFSWNNGELNEEELLITVTGENLYPHSDEVEIENAEEYIALVGFTIDDGDNGDGIANPGEEVSIRVELENRGERATPNWSVVEYDSPSPWVELWGEINGIERLELGESVEIQLCMTNISEGCPDGESILVNAEIEDINTVGFAFMVEAPALAFVEVEGEFEPGDESNLTVTITNQGHRNSAPLNARLESLVPFITVTDSDGRFPAVEFNEEVRQQGDPFIVRANDNTISGSVAGFRLILECEDFIDTVYFNTPVGEAAEGDPFGPDQYGYIALDNEDEDIEWADAPEYNWLDINSFHGVVEGTDIGVRFDGEEGDSTALIELPFPFRYYGQEFREISICSNGWIAVGDQTNLKNQQNWLLPGFDGAFGMIAVFWDRIRFIDEDDGVYVFYDEVQERFIIQWDCFVDGDEGNEANVFQAILFDPVRYPTPTGDNRILFQYNTANNVQDEWEANSHASVGISSPEGLDGLTYTYWNEYPASCAPLENGRAILWTTVSYSPLSVIHGQVTRWVDSTAVAGAVIQTSNGFETTTSRDGSYRLVGVGPEEFDITATARNYGEVVVDGIQIDQGEEIEQNFVLPHVWLTYEPDTLHFLFEILTRDELFTLEATGEGTCQFSLELSIPDNSINPEDIQWSFEPTEGEIETGNSQEIQFDMDYFGILEDAAYNVDLLVVNDTPLDTIVIPVSIIVRFNAVEDHNNLPIQFNLQDPFPNPFNTKTMLRFELPHSADVKLSILDISGRLINTITNEKFAAGKRIVTLDGDALPTGIYFIRMEAADFQSTKRVLLLR